MSLRKLTESEIKDLERQGCSSESWESISVSAYFNPERIRSVSFSGRISIGRLEKRISLPGGTEKPCGLYNSMIHNCSFGDNICISSVNYLANYDIGEDVLVDNVDSLVVDGKSAFGNGTEIDILNEAGGRSLKIFDRLSSQIAYLYVLYRHNESLIKTLETMIDQYVKSRISARGLLGRGCSILNSSVLRNLVVGPYAIVNGALHLEDGTIDSCTEDPIFIGEGVIARHFIILSGSKIMDSSIIESCFIGQGVTIGKQYSAENSAFFANCEGFHGEAALVFAGPYTVSHHKSTLMIAGLFSFYNAGSGTNQSNHMYKLGPVHQGILERGCKTGSYSYMIWPCRVGPFSAVIGKHGSNFDTSDFPFSYITEKEGISVLTPAMNLLSVGSRRDSEKWPARDRRKSARKLDIINFGYLNPYTVGRMVNGSEKLLDLHAAALEAKTKEFVTYKGVHIRRLMLKICSRYYEMGVKVFLGSCLHARLDKLSNREAGRRVSMEVVKEALAPNNREGVCDWVDLCGLIAPSESVEKLVDAVADAKIKDLDELSAELKRIHENYDEAEWSWCLNLLETRLGVKLEDFTSQHLSGIVTDWKQNTIKLNNLIKEDALKEYNASAMIGYGIDGGETEREKDFIAVRGTYEDNRFVKQIEEDSKNVEEKAEALLGLLDAL